MGPVKINFVDSRVALLVDKYNIQNDTYINQLIKHAKNLFWANIEPLYTISECPKEYYIHYYDLILATYFLDSVMDHSKVEDKQFLILSLFIGIDLFCSFRQWFCEEFDQEDVAEFEKYFKSQFEYQLVEQVVNYKSYSELFSTYTDNYWLKQCILLYPILAFCRKGYINYQVDEVKHIYHKYFSVLLQIDDYMDIDYDLKLEILTPLQAVFYNKNGYLATTKEELLRLKPEIVSFEDLPIAFQNNLKYMINMCTRKTHL